MCHSRLTPGTLPIRDPEGMDTLLILTNTLLPSISPPISPFGWPATHSIPKIFALSRAPSLAEHQAGIMGCIRAFSRHLLNPVSNPIMHKAGMYGPSQKAQKMLGRSLVESQVRGKLDVCFKGANVEHWDYTYMKTLHKFPQLMDFKFILPASFGLNEAPRYHNHKQLASSLARSAQIKC